GRRPSSACCSTRPPGRRNNRRPTECGPERSSGPAFAVPLLDQTLLPLSFPRNGLAGSVYASCRVMIRERCGFPNATGLVRVSYSDFAGFSLSWTGLLVEETGSTSQCRPGGT